MSDCITNNNKNNITKGEHYRISLRRELLRINTRKMIYHQPFQESNFKKKLVSLSIGQYLIF